MYTAVQEASWSGGKMVSDIPLTNQGGASWKVMYTTEPRLPRTKKAQRNDLISLSLWKNGWGLLFWNHISLKNTPKAKQNWQCWIYCPLLFCLWRPLFVPLPWKRRAYLSLRPFYNNVPFLSKQQRKYQVKPLPLSNDQLDSACAPTRSYAVDEKHTDTESDFRPSRRVFDVFRLISFRVKEKGGRSFLFSSQDVREAETLDGDREKWPSPSPARSLLGLPQRGGNPEYVVFIWKRRADLSKSLPSDLWKSFFLLSWWSNNTLFPNKTAARSRLPASGKSFWLVYSWVYSGCRLLFLLPPWGRWAITPFRALFSWKCMATASLHPHTTVADNRRNWQFW